MPSHSAPLAAARRATASGHPLPRATSLAYSPSLVRHQLSDFTLDGVELAEELQRLLANLAALIGPEFVELAPRVRQATGLGDAELEACLVATEVVAHQRAAPAMLAQQPEEGASMLAAPAVGEVEHHSAQRAVARRAVAPEVRPVCLAVAGLEHRHRRLVGMQHTALEHFALERIDQRLQLRTALSDPAGQCRARDGQPGATEDGFLSVQGQVVQGDGRLHERLALCADPFAANVALHREHARLIVEFLGHILADALEGAATGTGGALGLVADLPARQVRGQRLACFSRLADEAPASFSSSSSIAARSASMVSSNRLFCSALKVSDLAANFSRLSTAISCVSLSMAACLNAIS